MTGRKLLVVLFEGICVVLCICLMSTTVLFPVMETTDFSPALGCNRVFSVIKSATLETWRDASKKCIKKWTSLFFTKGQ